MRAPVIVLNLTHDLAQTHAKSHGARATVRVGYRFRNANDILVNFVR